MNSIFTRFLGCETICRDSICDSSEIAVCGMFVAKVRDRLSYPAFLLQGILSLQVQLRFSIFAKYCNEAF